MSEMLEQAILEIERLTADERPRLVSLAEIASLEPDPTYFEILDGAVLIYWGGYEYDISLSEIPNPLRLLGWISHMADKTWVLMTPDRIASLIDAVCHEKDWNLHTGEVNSPRA